MYHELPDVLTAYEYRCAVCGFDVRLGSVSIALDAAHIRWHQAGGADLEKNGLALCVLHHKTFDLGLHRQPGWPPPSFGPGAWHRGVPRDVDAASWQGGSAAAAAGMETGADFCRLACQGSFQGGGSVDQLGQVVGTPGGFLCLCAKILAASSPYWMVEINS
jgi:HNH endonuclease